jgi:4-carboxymuconolactone decarboxylase
MPPRIPPARIADLDSDARALLATVHTRGTGATNVFRTLVRHKGLFRHFLPYGGKLMEGKLPPRIRELAILRTARLCASRYEWAQHSRLAGSIGLSREEVEAVGSASGTFHWSDIDSAVLRAVDELHLMSVISSPVWEDLKRYLDEQQLIELPLLVGHFQGVAYLLNSLGIELEDPSADVPWSEGESQL